MPAARLVIVTLVRAWDPGSGARVGRIRFAVALDANGQPDRQAWLDDPEPWPAQYELPDGNVQSGDVAHDEETWQLRFATAEGADPDAPAHRLVHLPGGLRPGEVLTLRHPDGSESAWRVVGVAPAG